MQEGGKQVGKEGVGGLPTARMKSMKQYGGGQASIYNDVF
jgi:hypothetical protein